MGDRGLPLPRLLDGYKPPPRPSPGPPAATYGLRGTQVRMIDRLGRTDVSICPVTSPPRHRGPCQPSGTSQVSPVVPGGVRSTMSSTLRQPPVTAIPCVITTYYRKTEFVAVSLAAMGRATVGSPLHGLQTCPDTQRLSARRQRRQPGVDLVVREVSKAGVLALRIDDLDPQRVRREYIEDVFENSTGSASRGTLDRPVSTTSKRNYSLAARADYYRTELSNAVWGRFTVVCLPMQPGDVARRASGDRYATDPCLGAGLRLSPDEDRRQSSAAARPSRGRPAW